MLINTQVFEGKSDSLAPLLIAHGMLGSLSNWSSLSKKICKVTGRTVTTYDARNHGYSGHVDTMTYAEMAVDMKRLVDKNHPVVLMGHSMGGRTAMYTALKYPHLVDQLVVVDVSPVNRQFDVTDATEWNMAHYFYAMKAVHFSQQSLYLDRKEADRQLAHRITDPGLRAWLLMNVHQDEKTGEIGWKINLDAIHEAFNEEISVFPDTDFALGEHFDKRTLFIGGTESEYLPVSDHEQIRERFPNAQFQYIQGAGHWVHSQKPQQFLDVLFKFLKQSS